MTTNGCLSSMYVLSIMATRQLKIHSKRTVLAGFSTKDAYIHSLKLTAKAPENRPGPNRKVVFQPSIFRCYLSFREGSFFCNPKNNFSCWFSEYIFVLQLLLVHCTEAWFDKIVELFLGPRYLSSCCTGAVL